MAADVQLQCHDPAPPPHLLVLVRHVHHDLAVDLLHDMVAADDDVVVVPILFLDQSPELVRSPT